MLGTGRWVSKTGLQPHSLGYLSLSLGKMPLVSSGWLALSWALRLLRLLLELIETLELLLLLRLELLLPLLELLLLWLELLLLWLELLLLRLELLRLLDTLSSWVKVRSLSVRLELWCLLLELLLLLDLVELVEVVPGLAPGLLLEPVPLLLLLSCSLLPPDLLLPLSLSLLCKSLLLSSLTFPVKLSLNHLGQGLDVQAEEHVEGMFLSFFREGGELCLAVLLQVRPECEVLLVEGGLLLPGESLPGGGVCEWLETKLLVFKLLGNSKSLARSEDKLVCLGKVDIAKMSNESFSLLAR